MLERYSSEFLFVPGKLGTANFFPFPDNIKGLLGGSVVKNPPATQILYHLHHLGSAIKTVLLLSNLFFTPQMV